MSQAFSYQFQGRVAFVTGASTGIGRATAIEFARNGAQVAVIDVNTDAGGQTSALINSTGGNSIFLKCDVSKSAQVKEAIDQTVAHFGRIDFAFNNAGIEGESAPTADCSEENWDQVIDVNLKGVWLCMKHELAHMLKQGFGSIVNCSSIAGVVGFPNSPAYVASKHGILGLTKSAALEYAKSNIRVNSICPGVINTPMINRFTHGEVEAAKQLAGAAPMARIGEPREIATAALWLSSEQASFVTGQSLVVDGGWVAQ